MRQKNSLTPIVFGIIGVLIGAFIVYQTVSRTPRPLQWPVVSVAKKVSPSVVAVLNNSVTPTGEHTKGMGSGVVMNRQGDIITNYHVVAGASSLVVIMQNGHRYRAHVVGTDPPTDLAIIKISDKHLIPIQFSSSSNIVPGQLVVAIGNSLGLDHTVTAGVISAKDRVMYRDGWEYHLIQTDAAINPGNSGGALVNSQGQLIGINSSKIAQTGVEGIGFAIPSNVVRKISQQIIRYGHVRRPWIGAVVEPAGKQAPGALVLSVVPGSPAANAGIYSGDFITHVNGIPIRTGQQLIDVFQKLNIGNIVQVKVWRGGESLTLPVKLAEYPLNNVPSQKAQKAQ